MKPPLVYIIIVNWNLKEVTLECLDSLHRLNYPDFRIVVVDNASHDGSPEAIAARYPQVEQIHHSENRGSTAGYNSGFRRALEAGASFAMLINNDTLIEPEALNHLVNACLPEEVGMTGPLIYYASLPEKVWSAGAMRSRFTLDLIGNHGRGKSYSEIIKRDFLTSCALLVKREVLEKVGLMDEDFFVYQEETDYCYRVRKAGYHLLLVPQAKVWHKVSLSSGGSESASEHYWMAKNGILFYRKHAVWWQWPFVVAWRSGSAIKTTLRLLSRGKWKSLCAYWSGIYDGITFPLRKTAPV
jgi:GT2 family glycosyltransferase